MNLTIELTDEQNRLLAQRAGELGVSVEHLARAAVVDLISRPEQDYVDAAEHVLQKNAELYGRLS